MSEHTKAEEFQGLIFDMFQTLDDEEREEIQTGLANIRRNIKRQYPQIPISTDQILIAIVNAMFFNEHGKNWDQMTREKLKKKS